MSRMWWKDDDGNAVEAEKAQPEPVTEETRDRIKASLQSFKDAMNQPNPAADAARKERAEAANERRQRFEDHARRMEYLMHGLVPIKLANGQTMSLSLARATGAKVERMPKAPEPLHEFSQYDK